MTNKEAKEIIKSECYVFNPLNLDRTSNCRWTDMKTQSNNTRTNTIVCYKGIEKTLSEWADYYKIPYKLFVNRYLKGWTIEEIINTPKRGRRK